jgi:hypothetical protein
MAMDHAEALERIEIAAVEPDGLERLMAGDTSAAAAVAGHLAGCPGCTAELAQIRRVSATAREAVWSLPDPALRDRTLAFVRSVGRDRSGVRVEAVSAPVPADPVLADPVLAGPVLADPAPSRGAVRPAPGGRRYAALSGLAAAVVIAGVLGFATAGVVLAPGTDNHDSEIAVLSAVTETTMKIEQRPDATHLVLAATDGNAGTTGTLLFSPSDGELAMVADGLGPAPMGMEYGCWVEVDGRRRRIGRMYPGGGVQAWSGRVDGLADLPPGTVFGVSLVPIGGGDGEPLLTGRL